MLNPAYYEGVAAGILSGLDAANPYTPVRFDTDYLYECYSASGKIRGYADRRNSSHYLTQGLAP